MFFSTRKYLRKKLLNLSTWYIDRYGYKVLNARHLYPWQKSISFESSYNMDSYLPDDALGYLNNSNTRLQELKQKYQNLTHNIQATNLWGDKKYVLDEHLLYFRGDNPYIWQQRGLDLNTMAYAITYFWIKNQDADNLLSKCIEDNSFGTHTFNFNGKIISRDLLDSINEIIFLNKHIFKEENKKINILDIGAGYGRLAHRIFESISNVNRFYCTDAVAESTFISEYYIKYRELEKNVSIIPFHKFETIIEDLQLDLVINIHSFSEMDDVFIKYWIDTIINKKVKYLFIIPNANDNNGKKLISYNGTNFQLLIEKAGYKLIVKKPKYSEPVVQEYGISPTYYYLFQYNKYSK